MIELETKIRKWGNSMGVVIPLHKIAENQIKEGENVKIMITKKKGNILREMFGKMKFKKSTEQMMKEMDKALYDI